MVGDGTLGVATPIAVVLAGPMLGVGLRYYLERSGVGTEKRELLLSRVTTATLVSLGTVGLAGVALTSPGGWLVRAARLDAPVVAALADAALVVGTVELGLWGLKRSLSQVYLATQGPGYEYPRRNRRLLRVVRLGGLLAVTLPVTLSVAEIGTVGAIEATVWALVVLTGMQVAIFPAVENGGTYMRLPTDEERARIAGCCERFGLAPARIVLYTGEVHDTGIYHGGFGDQRTVRLPEALLSVDDDALAVALAQAEGKYRNRYRVFPQGMTYATFVGIVGIMGIILSILDLQVGRTVGGDVGFAAVATAGIVTFGVANRLSRRRVFAADRFASERLGAETVRDAYHRHGDAMSELPQNSTPEDDSLGRRIKYEPLMLDRIARLEAPARSETPAYASPESGENGGQRTARSGPPDKRSAQRPSPEHSTAPPENGGRQAGGDRGSHSPAENPHAPPDIGADRPPQGRDERRDRREDRR